MEEKLGKKASDNVTGFAGTITGVWKDLGENLQIGIQPDGLDKDGKPQDRRFFPEGRVTIAE